MFLGQRSDMILLFAVYREWRSLLEKCAKTALNSKLVAAYKDFFGPMVVDAVSMLDDLLPLNMIGIKKVSGGALSVIILVLQYFVPSKM